MYWLPSVYGAGALAAALPAVAFVPAGLLAALQAVVISSAPSKPSARMEMEGLNMMLSAFTAMVAPGCLVMWR
jgi:hypothetical protein